MSRKQSIGEMLLEAHLVDETQLAIALETQKRTGRKLGSVLIDLRFVDENVLAAFLSKQIDVPCVSLLNLEVPAAVRRRVPGHLAHRYGAVPIKMESGGLEVAMVDPTDIDQIAELEDATGLRIDPLVAPESSIRKLLTRIYPLGDDGLPEPERSASNDALFPDLIKDLEEGGGRIIQRLDAIESRLEDLQQAIERLAEKISGPFD